MDVRSVDSIDILTQVRWDEVNEAHWASVNNSGSFLFCEWGDGSPRENHVALYDTAGAPIWRHRIEWPVVCCLSEDGFAYVADQKYNDDDASTVSKFDAEGSLVAEVTLPVARVHAMDLSPCGRFLACAGQDPDEDTWTYETDALDAAPTQTPKPGRNRYTEVLKWAESADWFLAQSGTAKDYHYNFTVQSPGEKKPLWRGKGRAAIVLGEHVIVWTVEGNSLQVWAPGQKEPLREQQLSFDGELMDRPFSFGPAPHSLAAINGGKQLVISVPFVPYPIKPHGSTNELLVVEMSDFCVTHRYVTKGWSQINESQIYASRDGRFMIYNCHSVNRPVLFAASGLLQ